MRPASTNRSTRCSHCSVRNGARCARFPSTPGGCRSPSSRLRNCSPATARGKRESKGSRPTASSMTLRAPVDRVILVGGMSFATRAQGDEPPLYLFLRATVQELRDDVKKAVPVEPAQPREDDATEKEQSR